MFNKNHDPDFGGIWTQDELSQLTGEPFQPPFESFFRDELLTLLACTTSRLPGALARLREQLSIVTDKDEPKHVRAQAAIILGRNARSRDIALALPWFDLAATLGSVVGAWEVANCYLAMMNARVTFDRDLALLPGLCEVKDTDRSSALFPGPETSDAWLRGIHIALDQVNLDFCHWDHEEFSTAFDCILNWITLLPVPLMRMKDKSHEAQILRRREAMKWINPLWRRLVSAVCGLTDDSSAEYKRRLAQLKAMCLYVEEGSEDDVDIEAFLSAHEAPAPARESDGVIVVKGKIAPGADKTESNLLAQYEPLRSPVALTQMPDGRRLQAIRTALEKEFAWATQAVQTVLNAVLARQRHGATRLGLHPILLVGRPGSGKTRFAQRLSELLGTPNTVINMAGMTDVKTLKGVTRGWASNRPSRLLEFIQQTGVANPLFILDEVDKAKGYEQGNGGCPHDALLDLLETGNARRYSDIFLMAECDLSHCLFIATANSLEPLPAPLLSRFDLVFFPEPGPEHAEVLIQGIVRDLESEWNLPAGALCVTPRLTQRLRGLGPRDMRRAMLRAWGDLNDETPYQRH